MEEGKTQEETQQDSEKNVKFATKLALVVAVVFFVFWTVVIGILEPIAQAKRQHNTTSEAR